MRFDVRFPRILFAPRTEWPVIADEPATKRSIYLGYVLPLAAIPALMTLGEASGNGMHWHWLVHSGNVRLTIAHGIGLALVRYALAFVEVCVLAFAVNTLAPRFSGSRDAIQALKVAAYGVTALWVAAVWPLLQEASWLGVFGLYSVYLLFLGLPILMKSPRRMSLGYTAVVAVCAVLLFSASRAIILWLAFSVWPWALWRALHLPNF